MHFDFVVDSYYQVLEERGNMLDYAVMRIVIDRRGEDCRITSCLLYSFGSGSVEKVVQSDYITTRDISIGIGLGIATIKRDVGIVVVFVYLAFMQDILGFERSIFFVVKVLKLVSHIKHEGDEPSFIVAKHMVVHGDLTVHLSCVQMP